MIKSFKRLKKDEKKSLIFGLLLFAFLLLIQTNPHSSQGVGQVVTRLYVLLATASFGIGAKPLLKNLFKTKGRSS
jgi:hypothetical protein